LYVKYDGVVNMEFSKFVPFTNNRYVLTQLGDVVDTHDIKSVVHLDDGLKKVTMDWYDGYKDYDLGLVIVCTFWGLNIPREFWNRLVVGYKDNDDKNNLPCNIYFTIPSSIESKEFPGHFYIPGFSRYVINRDGVLINEKTGKIKKWYVSKPIPEKGIRGGYRITQIYNDRNERSNLSRHRALALTFIPTEKDPSTLVVNHKDGIGGNDEIDNLEWVSHQGNVKHAYENGLYDKKLRSVLVKSMETGEIVAYKSMIECCQATGINHATLSNRLNNNPGKFYSNGFAYKGDDATPWINEVVKERLNRDVIFRNVFTGETVVSSSIASASKISGCKKGTIWKHIVSGSMKPLNGFFFRYFDERKPEWPKLTSDELIRLAEQQATFESPQQVTAECKDIELLESA